MNTYGYEYDMYTGAIRVARLATTHRNAPALIRDMHEAGYTLRLVSTLRDVRDVVTGQTAPTWLREPSYYYDHR